MTTAEPQTANPYSPTDIDVLGSSPAFAMSAIYTSMANSMGIMFENAVTVQNNQNTLAATATNVGVLQLQKLDTIADVMTLLEHMKKQTAA